MFACAATDDFFRSRIDHMNDLRHPLAVLASRMPWQEIEARVAQVFSRKGRAGVALPESGPLRRAGAAHRSAQQRRACACHCAS
jgi:hypothetical protein